MVDFPGACGKRNYRSRSAEHVQDHRDGTISTKNSASQCRLAQYLKIPAATDTPLEGKENLTTSLHFPHRKVTTFCSSVLQPRLCRATDEKPPLADLYVKNRPIPYQPLEGDPSEALAIDDRPYASFRTTGMFIKAGVVNVSRAKQITSPCIFGVRTLCAEKPVRCSPPANAPDRRETAGLPLARTASEPGAATHRLPPETRRDAALADRRMPRFQSLFSLN